LSQPRPEVKRWSIRLFRSGFFQMIEQKYQIDGAHHEHVLPHRTFDYVREHGCG